MANNASSSDQGNVPSTTSSIPSSTLASILLESPQGQFASEIVRQITTTPANGENFLGVSAAAWFTMIGVLAGLIALVLICALICCFCCAAIAEAEEGEKKKRKEAVAAPAASIRRRTSSVSSTNAPPVKTETVIDKEIDHLPDGRDLTTVTSVRTTTSSDGSRNHKTSRIQFLSKKSNNKHLRRHHHSRPQLTSIRPLSSQIEQPHQQRPPTFPMQRSKTPRASSTMVEMEPTLPQPPVYQQEAAVEPSSRRSPFSAPRSPAVANYNVEPQPQHYPY